MSVSQTVADFRKRFGSEAKCAAFIARARWGGKPVCPRCGHGRVYRVAGAMGYKCAGCRKRFSVRTGTAMAYSRVSLRTWLLAIRLMTGPNPEPRPRGMKVARALFNWLALHMAAGKSTARDEPLTCARFARELGVTEKTAWSLAERIRAACAAADGGGANPPARV